MLNDDKFLRDILSSGIEQPSSNFTSKVMKELAKAQIKQKQQVEIPTAIIWMAVLFPLIALTVSLESVYKQVSAILQVVGLDKVLTQETIIFVSLGILAFSFIDIVLIKWFVKHEHHENSRGGAFFSI
ncbi:hypothetical protein [uncultured Acetobacteroides sp.]|uniref:hypothetical protein n=1 Tax=uncultured Acetobacteroides sp. TaxID=1760811 RepID=UPI0029F4DA6B|nr:hypothetical protein [uncultured Acetobacteroides sp.]